MTPKKLLIQADDVGIFKLRNEALVRLLSVRLPVWTFWPARLIRLGWHVGHMFYRSHH